MALWNQTTSEENNEKPAEKPAVTAVPPMQVVATPTAKESPTKERGESRVRRRRYHRGTNRG